MLLDLEPDVVVVGEAGDAEAAKALAASAGPCVALIDIAALGEAGTDAILGLRQTAPHVAVVVLSLKDDRQSRARALAAGTLRFVCKDEGPEALVCALRSAAAGVTHPSDPQA
jgi:DNA-binding NarL/FixJ family response regulator